MTAIALVCQAFALRGWKVLGDGEHVVFEKLSRYSLGVGRGESGDAAVIAVAGRGRVRVGPDGVVRLELEDEYACPVEVYCGFRAIAQQLYKAGVASR